MFRTVLTLFLARSPSQPIPFHQASTFFAFAAPSSRKITPCVTTPITTSTTAHAMTTSSSNSIDKDTLTNWVGEMYDNFTGCTNSHKAEDVEAFWDKNFIDHDAIFVRPSTNPMTLQDYIDMATSQDITSHSGKLINVEYIKMFANGQAAVIFFEASQKFMYKKDTANDDNAKYSATVEKQSDGSLKMAFMQRYSGKSNLL